MPLPSFSTTGNLNDILPAPTAGELTTEPWTSARIVFSHNIKRGVLVWAGEIYNRPPEVGVFPDSDGDIAPVVLLANDADLNVTGIQWTATVLVGGSPVVEIPFNAPADGGTVDLATVTPVPHATPIGMTRGEHGDSLDNLERDGDDLVGSVNGVEVGRFDISDLTFDGDIDDITDATTVGKAVVRATNASAARTAINAGSTVINVKDDHSAVGDGTADDGAAFLAAFTAALAGADDEPFTEDRALHCINIPAGTYRITGNAKFIANLAITRTRGIKFSGAGVDSTMIIFEPSAANGYLCNNADDLLYLTFENMSFQCVGTHAATATWMKSDSDGGAQNYVFNRVNWDGTWKYGLDLTGSNNNGEHTWYSCSVRGVWNTFLYAGASDTSDQFLNYNFNNCNVEYTAGDFISMAKGGNVNVWGGGFIHAGDGTETTSSPQCFFKFLGASHASGVPRLYVEGLRVEHRHEDSQLIYCEWERGNVTFVSCDTEAFQPVLATPTNVVQAEFGANAQSYPIVTFADCSLMGKHSYHFGSGTYNHVHRPSYRNCEIQTYLQAKDFINYVNDDATDTGRRPAVLFANCRSSMATDYKETFDTTVNWHDSTNVVVSPKVLSIRIPWSGSSGLPNTSLNNWGANLPLHAIITRVRCFKSAGGSATATNVTYTLKDADATTIATADTSSAAWNTSWTYDSGALRYVCSTDNKRKLTLTAANTSESFADSYFLVEYLA